MSLSKFENSDAIARPPSMAFIGHEHLDSVFERYEGPTILLTILIYGTWFLLVIFHSALPWWILAPLAGYVVQWHFSLQHEAIHAMRGLPKWLRTALVWAPIGCWLPYALFRRSHSQHHRNHHLTYPGEDTESFYHEDEDWRDYGGLRRGLLIINQTFLGRLFLGPFLHMPRFYFEEIEKIVDGNFSNGTIWLRHFVAVGLILAFVASFDIPAWQYFAYFMYPSLIFGMMRSYTEHRWGKQPSERTAVVESNWVFGLLFLWNNIHAVHHLYPTLSWYKIPRVWREQRDRIQAHNAGFVFSGYGEIAWRWLLRPNFVPVHPPSREQNGTATAHELPHPIAARERSLAG
jgi:fatty acid desaturase